MDEPPEEDARGGRVAHLPLGIVIRRQPGVTRWAKWAWRPVAVIPGAGPADWRELRRDGETVDYHAATLTLELHRADTEGYVASLAAGSPCVYVILRRDEDPGAERPLQAFAVTASAFEAQNYSDSSEDIVEPVPMPPELIAWLSNFADRHHHREGFVKRQRRRWDAGQAEPEGPRAPQEGDVYRAPTAGRRTVH